MTFCSNTGMTSEKQEGPTEADIRDAMAALAGASSEEATLLSAASAAAERDALAETLEQMREENERLNAEVDNLSKSQVESKISAAPSPTTTGDGPLREFSSYLMQQFTKGATVEIPRVIDKLRQLGLWLEPKN